jgi:hypothetical protein
MKSTAIGGILVLALSIGMTGCVGLESKTKASHDQPRIREQDISDDDTVSARVERQGGGRAGTDPSERYPGPSSWPGGDSQLGRGQTPGTSPSLGGYPNQSSGEEEEPPPPRRFKWRDKQGHERGWEIKERTEDSR